jgi:hypothetical protein
MFIGVFTADRVAKVLRAQPTEPQPITRQARSL